MKIDLELLLLFRIESCHQVVTQLWDRVKVMWHMRKVFAVVGEFWCWVLRLQFYGFLFGKLLAN